MDSTDRSSALHSDFMPYVVYGVSRMSIDSSETALSIRESDRLRIKGSTLLGMPPCHESRQPREMGQIKSTTASFIWDDASPVMNTFLGPAVLDSSWRRPVAYTCVVTVEALT